MKEKCEACYHNYADTKQKVNRCKNLWKFKAQVHQLITIEYIAPGQGKDVIDNQSYLYLSKKKGNRTEQ
jgi:hypothetical protein